MKITRNHRDLVTQTPERALPVSPDATYSDGMSIPGAFATALAAALLLSSCAASSTPPSNTADNQHPTPSASQPAFLLAEQQNEDLLPEGVPERVKVESESTRYQGNWDGHQIYLAVKGSNSVCLVTGLGVDVSSWNAGCGDSSGVVSDEFPDGGTVKYLPMATTAAPEGWTRLSDFVFVK